MARHTCNPRIVDKAERFLGHTLLQSELEVSLGLVTTRKQGTKQKQKKKREKKKREKTAG